MISVVAESIDVALLVIIDAEDLAGTLFSGLSALVIEDVTDGGDEIVVRARTRGEPVACPDRGEKTSRVHGYHQRIAADVPVDGRRERGDERQAEPGGDLTWVLHFFVGGSR